MLCFYPVFTVLVGNGVLIGLSQARETLTAFDEIDAFTFSELWFLFAVLYWSVTAWYCSRIMLGRRFPLDDLPRCISPDFAIGVNRWLPRVLGAASTFPIAIFFILAKAPFVVWGPIAATTTLFFVFVIMRRKMYPIARRGIHALRRDPYPRFSHLRRPSRIFIGMVFAVSSAVLLAVWVSPVAAPRAIGAPILLLIALGSWTVFGSMALTYWPRIHKWPSLAWLPVLLALLSSLFRENHLVAQDSSVPASFKRPALVEDFNTWNNARGTHKNEPVYLIASAGGASRAAYWTGIVLANIENAARANKVRFAPNIYAVSGVSGGSLGLAAFVGSLAAESAVKQPHGDRMNPDPLDYLGKDFLSPLIGGMLYPDAIATFYPGPCPSCDRSHAIEKAWTDDWRALPGSAAQADWFAQPMLVKEQDALPRIFLNSTSVSDGRRVVQSRVQFVPSEGYDLLDEELDTGRLTLAGAVHNSARFPYASPAGQVRLKGGKGTWDYLIDGGLFENSGAATLQALIRELVSTKNLGLDATQFVVLLIENEPVTGVQWICPNHPLKFESRARRDLPFWPAVTAPLLALYETRTARAQAAEHDVISLLGDCSKSSQVYEFRYPKLTTAALEPPMSWFLNQRTQAAMRNILCLPSDEQPLRLLRQNWGAFLEQLGINRAGVSFRPDADGKCQWR